MMSSLRTIAVAAAVLSPVAAGAQRPIIAAVLSPTSASRMAADVLAQSKATYAALQSYADSGTVLNEFGANPKNPSKEVVDVIVAPDGALLVSDDANGVVYRIDYAGR